MHHLSILSQANISLLLRHFARESEDFAAPYPSTKRYAAHAPATAEADIDDFTIDTLATTILSSAR